jgi:hypothetical protein
MIFQTKICMTYCLMYVLKSCCPIDTMALCRGLSSGFATKSHGSGDFCFPPDAFMGLETDYLITHYTSLKSPASGEAAWNAMTGG